MAVSVYLHDGTTASGLNSQPIWFASKPKDLQQATKCFNALDHIISCLLSGEISHKAPNVFAPQVLPDLVAETQHDIAQLHTAAAVAHSTSVRRKILELKERMDLLLAVVKANASGTMPPPCYWSRLGVRLPKLDLQLRLLIAKPVDAGDERFIIYWIDAVPL